MTTELRVSLFSSAFAWCRASPVSFLNRAARSCSIRAAEVSGMTKNPTLPVVAAMMSVIQEVHRQPRYDSAMKPPAMGPATGPANPPAAKMQIAYARGIGSHKSASAPPTMANGADAKKPLRNRPTQIVATFCASATGIWKMANSANPKNNGVLRPSTSDMGPNATGPNTNPYINFQLRQNLVQSE